MAPWNSRPQREHSPVLPRESVAGRSTGAWRIAPGSRFVANHGPMELSPHLKLSREQVAPDVNRRQLSRDASSGAAVRLRRGVYFPAGVWSTLSLREQHIARMAAAVATRRSKPLFSHQSAAAFWGLPMLTPWPTLVHVTVEPHLGSRSSKDLIRHSTAVAAEDVVEAGEFSVTSIARTVLDLAATCPFIESVVVADRALLVDRFGGRPPMTTHDELEAAWVRATPMRAPSRTRAVLGFAVTQAESPLESVSRVNIRAVGLPRPRLQVPHYDSAGFIGSPDFFWEEFGVVGEADGDMKYLDEKVRGSRSAEQVVLDEKIREDRFRALPRTVARWRWNVAINPAVLRARLVQSGLPTGYKW